MLVHAHDRRIDHLHDRLMSSGQRLHDLVPDASPPPADEPIVAGRTRSVDFRQIAPWCARPQHPEDAIEDASVVHAGNATRLVREHRFDDAPFAVAQFIAHDSMLHFESLNHAQDQGINGQTACPLLEGERTYGGHREIDAIDPQRSLECSRRLSLSPQVGPI
jgi:hypothetical protein